MSKLQLFFIVNLLFYASVAGAQSTGSIAVDSFEEVAGRGLVIRTNPARVKVYIDGVERGAAPLTINSLAPGEYTVKLVREGYIEREFTVVVFKTSRLIVSIRMEKDPDGYF